MTTRLSNIPVRGLMFQEKANDLTKALNINDFKTWNGWLDE